MKTIFLTAIILYALFIIIDGIWLSLTVSRFYRPLIGHLWIQNINYTYAVVFYLLYAIAVAFLILDPAIEYNYSFVKVFYLGFIFGFAAYGCYDITNQATLPGWPFIVTAVDMVWGGLLTGTSSFLTIKIFRHFF